MSYVLGGDENTQNLNLKFFNDIIISPEWPDGQVYYKKGIGFYIVSEQSLEKEEKKEITSVKKKIDKSIYKKN